MRSSDIHLTLSGILCMYIVHVGDVIEPAENTRAKVDRASTEKKEEVNLNLLIFEAFKCLAAITFTYSFVQLLLNIYFSVGHDVFFSIFIFVSRCDSHLST